MYYYCSWGGIAHGDPYTATITDLLYFPISVPIIPDLPIRALWQQPAGAPSSKVGEIWLEMSVNFSYKYLFHVVGFFNML
jgi:hypothetical protein